MTAAPTRRRQPLTRDELAAIIRRHVEGCPRCRYLMFTSDDKVPCCREGAALHRAWRALRRVVTPRRRCMAGVAVVRQARASDNAPVQVVQLEEMRSELQTCDLPATGSCEPGESGGHREA